jgi:hypothetical protein
VTAADWIAVALPCLFVPWLLVTAIRSRRRWKGTGE